MNDFTVEFTFDVHCTYLVQKHMNFYHIQFISNKDSKILWSAAGSAHYGKWADLAGPLYGC